MIEYTTKYNNQIISKNIIEEIIQAIWLIDEKAIILRSLVWFSPIIPLIIIDEIIMIDINNIIFTL